jgi:hypothetical protein
MPTRLNVNDSVELTVSIQPQSTATAAVNGTSRDTRNDPHGARYLAIGSVGNWTDGSLLFVVQDSADDSSFATLAPFDGAWTAIAADNVVQTVAFVPVTGRPFVRLATTEDSAITTALPFAGVIAMIPPN